MCLALLRILAAARIRSKEEYVPFEGIIEFETPEAISDIANRGALIVRKDNPSGLPEHDDALEIPILYEMRR